MKRKRIILIIGITLIVSIYGIYIKTEYNSYVNKKLKEDKIITKEINTNYIRFKKEIDKIVEKRTNLYEESSSFFSYYESIKLDYPKVLKNYNEYEELIKKMDNNSKYLLDKCIDKDYASVNAIKQCYTFLNNYEQVINCFVKDVDLFNEKVISFNKWTNDKSNILEQYISKKYNKFIDINNDKNYIGKEED